MAFPELLIGALTKVEVPQTLLLLTPKVEDIISSIHTIKTSYGNLYRVYEANGGFRDFSTEEEAKAYTPNTTDPSENILNQGIFDAISLYPAAKGAWTLAKSIPSLAKSAWNTGIKIFTRPFSTTAKIGAATVAKAAPKIGASMLGGAAVNKVSELTTGHSFDSNVSSVLSTIYGFEVPEFVGGFMNPGYYYGYKALPWLAEDLTPRVYKYVSPAGYFNTLRSRLQEASDIAKSFLKREKIDINANPLWIEDGGIGASTGRGFNVPTLSSKAETLFRDDAFRKYLGFPEREGHNLYLDNGDGTWSYNMDYIQSVRRNNPTIHDIEYMDNGVVTGLPTKLVLYVENPETFRFTKGSNVLGGDILTGNGGHVRIINPGNGNIIMEDVWNVEPFSSSTRVWQNPVGKALNILFPKFELSSVLSKNARPFTLRYEYKPDGFIIKDKAKLKVSKDIHSR